MSDCKDIKPSVCGTRGLILNETKPKNSNLKPLVTCGENTLYAVDCGQTEPCGDS